MRQRWQHNRRRLGGPGGGQILQAFIQAIAGAAGDGVDIGSIVG
jgi:hypothetical protein